MLNPIIRKCSNCDELKHIQSRIECTLLDMIKNKYYSQIYGVEGFFNEFVYKDLVRYKRIISYRLTNKNYPCSSFSTQDIMTKAYLLTYKEDCSRCPECFPPLTP